MNQRSVYICFGGNMGNPLESFQKARVLLEERIGKLVGSSKLYQTTPLTQAGIDPKSVPTYLNAAVQFYSTLLPHQILIECLAVEKILGRVRNPLDQLASRTIDIDIALIEDTILNDSDLTIPHPRMHERDFMMQPLVDISPLLRHTKTNILLQDLLKELQSTFVELSIAPNW